MSDQTDVLQGTLDLLIMRTLAMDPMHGWAIAQRIQQISDELLRVQQGSLYPALHRFDSRGWVTSYWRTTGNNRIARYYQLTAAGRHALAGEIERWRSYTTAVDHVIDAEQPPSIS